MSNLKNQGRPKAKNPQCRICKTLLIPGNNCVPSAIRRGEYLCRVHKREKERVLYRKRRDKDPEYQARKSREYRAKYPHIELKARLKKFNLSVNKYYTLIKQQNNRCSLCGNLPKKRALAVDHCHNTGIIRGLLCVSCNTSLGQLGDTVESLQRVIKYLKGEL